MLYLLSLVKMGTTAARSAVVFQSTEDKNKLNAFEDGDYRLSM